RSWRAGRRRSASPWALTPRVAGSWTSRACEEEGPSRMQPLVITIKNVTTGEQRLRAFYRSPVHVGRNELNDLPIPNGYVSLWHAVIRFDEEAIRYTDLGSKNGSEVSGARV